MKNNQKLKQSFFFLADFCLFEESCIVSFLPFLLDDLWFEEPLDESGTVFVVKIPEKSRLANIDLHDDVIMSLT